jgi:hypothetical protein
MNKTIENNITNYVNLNNNWIQKLLETKSYSLIISNFTGKNTNHFELSMYKLLQTIYNNNKLFDFGVRYLILRHDNLEQNKIDYLQLYIKSKSIIEYTFMHKYVLKTPEFVSQQILQIEKLNYRYNYFRIRHEEKNYILRYELNDFQNNFENTNIIWLYSIFILDEVEEYEYNVLRTYKNKTNGLKSYDKVIFYEHLKTMIFISDYFVSWANENIDSWYKINQNELITYKYSDWINKYFGGNINAYVKN